MKKKTIIFYNILILCILYILVAVLFAIVYIGLDLLDLGSIIDHNSSIAHQKQPLDLFTRSLYFSSITLFAVGYGDMSPLGLAKGVAILEALIGYILPYALLLNYVVFNPKIMRHYRQKNN